MSFSVTLYTFSKRGNSTARPTDGRNFSCIMRHPSGVINPEISLELPAGENPSAYNYAHIPTFGRYYYIREWTASGRLWVASLSVDALASWRESIAAQRMYVLRSSAQSDPQITDMLYPSKVGPDVEYEYYSFDNWSYSFSSGTYIVGILSPDQNGVGACVYYAMTSAQFREFNHYLLSNIDWVSPDEGLWNEISKQLGKILFNPFQYVASCIWVPLNISGTSVSEIPYGWNWSIECAASRLSGSLLYSSEMTVSVPPHPDYAQFGSFIHSAPFSKYVLSVPPFGVFPLDANLAATTEELTITVDTDAMTGAARLQVRGAGYTFVDTAAQVGVQVQLAQSSANLEKAAHAVVQVAGGAGGVFGGNALGGAKNIASGVVDALEFAGRPAISTFGSTGSNATLGPVKMEGIFYHPVETSPRLFGKPLCRDVVLATVQGYLQIDSPHVSIACTETEREAIEGYMRDGFFLDMGV